MRIVAGPRRTVRVTGFILPGLVLFGVIYSTGIVVAALAVVSFRIIAWFVGADMSGIDPWWKVAGRVIAWPRLIRDTITTLRQLHEHR